jgi:hypothetical protein
MSVIVEDHDEVSRSFFERSGYTGAARRPAIRDGWQTPSTEWEWILLYKPQGVQGQGFMGMVGSELPRSAVFRHP